MEIRNEVIDYFKSRLLPENTFISAKIIEKKIVSPKEPRFIVEVAIENPQKKIVTFAYNYKRLLRNLGLRDE